MISTFHFEGLAAFIALWVIVLIIIGIPALIIGMFYSGFFRRWKKHNNYTIGVVVTEYDPPDKLTPAEISYMYDNRVSFADIIATMLSLKQRGLVTIYNNSSGIIYELSSTIELPKLKYHEQYIYEHFYANKTITNLNVYSLKQFKTELIRSLHTSGYISKINSKINWIVRRILFTYFIIVSAFTVSMLLIPKSDDSDLLGALIVGLVLNIILAPAFLVISLIIGILFDKIVGQPGIWSAKKKEIWPKIEGYREYIRQVELDNIRFENEKIKSISKNHALPYAVALGFNTEWKASFKKS